MMALELLPNDFDKAFAQLSQLEGDPSLETKITKIDPPAPAPAPAPTPAPVEGKKVDPPAPAPVPEPVEAKIEPVLEPELPLEPPTPEEVAAAAEVKKPAPEPDDMLRRLADMLQEGRAAPQPQSELQRQPVPEPALFTQEEIGQLQQFQKDWPEVAIAQQLMVRAAVQQVTRHIFTEIAATIGPKLALLDSLADHTMANDLQTAIPDYNTVRDKVVDWVGKQPTYLQTAYNHVIQQGSVDEVRDLIDRFKRDGGAPLAPALVPAKKPATELSTTAIQAAAKLAPISTKRSAVVQQVDLSDYDGAFQEAVKALAS